MEQGLSASVQQQGVLAIRQKSLNNPDNRSAYIIIKSFRNRPKPASFSEIADYLNNNGYKTRNSNQFSKGSCKTLYDRFFKIEEELGQELSNREIEVKLDGSYQLKQGIHNNVTITPIHKKQQIRPRNILLFKSDQELAQGYFRELDHIVNSAKEELVVFTFLGENGLKKSDQFSQKLKDKFEQDKWQYFQNLENKLLSNPNFRYKRILQLPLVKCVNGMTHENHLLASALFFLCESISNHLEKVCSLNVPFELYLSVFPTEAISFIQIDGKRIIQDSQPFFQEPVNLEKQILIYDSGPILNYIQLKLNSILQYAQEIDFQKLVCLNRLLKSMETGFDLDQAYYENYNFTANILSHSDWFSVYKQLEELKQAYPNFDKTPKQGTLAGI